MGIGFSSFIGMIELSTKLPSSMHCRPKSDDITLSLLKRAKDNGYSALVVTLDNFSIGWRTHDINASMLLSLSTQVISLRR